MLFQGFGAKAQFGTIGGYWVMGSAWGCLGEIVHLQMLLVSCYYGICGIRYSMLVWRASRQTWALYCPWAGLLDHSDLGSTLHCYCSNILLQTLLALV